MAKRLTGIIMALIIAVATASAAAPGWEEVNSPRQEIVQSIDMDNTTDVYVRDGYIYIWSQRPVNVKLVSILGQQLRQDTVPAGLHRLRLNTKGIFILRAGSLTKRITL
jgi:hypothetical protein